jgi:hypothetical protein
VYDTVNRVEGLTGKPERDGEGSEQYRGTPSDGRRGPEA